MLVYTSENQHSQKRRKCKNRCGRGLMNRLINSLPVELHIPGYQYCGPGTKLAKRLARGDPGINPLDAACREHDIAYSKNRENISARNAADRVLAKKALTRLGAADAGIGEKTASFLVGNAMRLKSRFGMGLNKCKKQEKKPKKSGKGHKKSPTRGRKTVGSSLRKQTKTKKKVKERKKTSFTKIIKAAKNTMKLNQGSDMAIHTALEGAQAAVREVGGHTRVSVPRTIPVPSKVGGFIPFLVPLLSGLSAIGALAGGAAGVAKAVNEVKTRKKELEENKRHNKLMESIALGKGLHLKPYKKGMGLFMKKKNFKINSQ